MGEFFGSSIVWYNISFGVIAAIQVVASNEFIGGKVSFANVFRIISIIGMLLCLLRFVMMSINYEWWYGLMCFLISSIICGIVAESVGRLGRLIIGMVAFVAGPVFWYLGGMF